mmetsp:Transcript_25922/g.22858  ORF Transcript_25922/g.22858 Transcript_25922/m.22858 type:complete len:129 (+) Transcript_25922:139-525(+)
MRAENMFGQPFAKASAECLKNNVERGFLIDDKERFQTMAGTSFKSYYPVDEKNVLKKNAFNVLKETQQLTKLAQEHDNGEDEIEEIPPIDRLPVPGYQGYRPIYKNPIKKDKVKPKIRESDLKNIALG